MLPGPLRGSFESLSEHVVYSSELYADLRSRVIRMESAMVDLSLTPRSDGDHRAYRAVQLLRPYAVDVPLLRVGAAGDGGYVMADAFPAQRAISVGVGPDVSWDVDVAHRGIAVAMFDPTVPGPPEVVPGGSFHRVGLGTPEQVRTTGLELAPLERLVALADADSEDALLKIDVEGAEWDALADVDDYARFPQVAMELHDLRRLDDEEEARNVLTVLEALHRTHLPIHLHGNNEEAAVRFDRLWLPDALEVTYLRRDLAPNARPADRLDTSLDAPSNGRFADVDLSGMLLAAPIDDPAGPPG
jgi:hypothetical protein